MKAEELKVIEVVCPCCGGRLTVDAALAQVIAHEAPPRRKAAVDLDDASQRLAKEAVRREEQFRRSAEQQKTRAQLLDRKFAEALKKTRDEPGPPPVREIDLD
jgi:hypothetical protein